MKIETYERAKDLIDDINRIEEQISGVNAFNHWIAISTPNYPNVQYSIRFQEELAEWLSLKKKEYQKEFDELR